MKMIIKVFIYVIESCLLIILGLDLLNFYLNHEYYYIGSESMIDAGGWKYQSYLTYIFINTIYIFSSIVLLFFAYRNNRIKYLLLILFLVFFQITCLFLFK